MFYTQFRFLSAAKRASPSIQDLKCSMLKKAPKRHLPRFIKYGPKHNFDSKFFNAYFNFARSCRMNGKTPLLELTSFEKKIFYEDLKANLLVINKQTLDWARSDLREMVYLRKVRSALAFLEEDFICHEKELYSSIGWRTLKSEGIPKIDKRLVDYASSWDLDGSRYGGKVDLRAVPNSHNWWENGDWSFENSRLSYGKNIDEAPKAPLIPLLEYKPNHKVNVFEVECTLKNPEKDVWIFKGFFERQLRLRHLQLHPVSTFNPGMFHEEGYLKSFKCFDALILFIFEYPNEVLDDEINPLILRSAIQFMEEDIVPFVRGAEPIWQEFMNSNGMELLNKQLLKHWDVPIKFRHLENIPVNHTWWPEKHRKNPGAVIDITSAFDIPRERMLCYLNLLADASRQSPNFCRITGKFYKYYFDYVRMCLKYNIDPIEMLGQKGIEEFQQYFPRALPNINNSIRKFKTMTSIRSLRRMRSSLEFFKDQGLHSVEIQKIMAADGLRRLDEVLEIRLGEDSDSHSIWYYKQNMECAVPPSHKWWPKEEFKKLWKQPF